MSQIENLMWDATAAAAAGAFLSEALRRKQEREQQIEDYYRSRPVKVEAEGKGGRMTGKQIARAYQAVVEQRRKQEAAEQAALAEMRRQTAIDARLTHKETMLDWKSPSENTVYIPSGISAWKERDYAQAGAPTDNKSWQQRAWEGITTAAQKVTGAVAGVLSPQKTGSYKLAAPVKDGLPWWEKLIERGKEFVQSATEKVVEAKRWFTGEDVGYTGSGWGHGPRQWLANRLGLDSNVGNVFTLVSRSLLQYDKVHLSGSVLEKIQTDLAMQELENAIIEAAETNPKFGREAFSLDEWEKKKTYEFGGNRTPGDMWEQLKHPLSGLRGNTIEYIQTHGLLQTVRDLFDPNKDVIRLNYADTWKVGFNELTWATRHATVTAQVQVSEQGEIHVEYHLQDELDLEPSPGRNDAYNTITQILGRVYHDILGGNDQMQVEAHWSSDR